MRAAGRRSRSRTRTGTLSVCQRQMSFELDFAVHDPRGTTTYTAHSRQFRQSGAPHPKLNLLDTTLTAIVFSAMSYNYTHVLSSLSPPALSPPSPSKSPRLGSSPVLLSPLPASLALQRESLAQSELELDKQIRQRQRERDLAEALQEQEWEVQRAASRADSGTWRHGKTVDKGKVKISGPTTGFIRPPQAYELYQAIDKHDIDFIMRVRDHAFPLLLQKNAGEFPIVYAARIGDSHRDVVILLVGAFSRYVRTSYLVGHLLILDVRYVNHLELQDFEKKETKNLLKALSRSLRRSNRLTKRV